MWESITKPTEIEKRLLARNKRHLQQTYIEGGASAEAPMSDFLSNHGIGEASKALLSGKYEIDTEVTPEIPYGACAIWKRPQQRKTSLLF